MSKEPSEEKRAKYERPDFRAVSESETFAGYGQQSYYSPGEQQTGGWDYYSYPYYYPYGYSGGGAEQAGAEEAGTRTPLCTLRDEEEWYLLEVELPGAEPQEIDVYVGDYDVIVMTDPGGDDKSGDTSSRRFYGALTLPEEIDPEPTETNYSNGILYVQLAKLKPPVRKHFRVGEGGQGETSSEPEEAL
jgi:HSP20 family molecular chaperone IbpA